MNDHASDQADRDLMAAMTQAFAAEGWEPGALLPAHMPRCFGCGHDNPHGIGIRVHVAEDPDAVTCEHVFDHRHQGAPGVAHGGAVAAAVDDLFGFVLVRVLTPAVTRDLALTYRLPVRLRIPTRLDARLIDRAERDLHMQATVTQDDVVVVTAHATFVEVDMEHLAAPAARFGLT